MRRSLRVLAVALALAGFSAAVLWQGPRHATAASYLNTAPNSWFAARRADAAAYAGIDPRRMGGYETDYYKSATADNLTLAPTGSGASTLLTTLTGRVQLTTGATASSTARVVMGSGTFVPANERVLLASRARIITTADAQADIRVVSGNSILASDYFALRLQNGVLSIAQFKGGVSTITATTWTPETTAYHDFALAFNATTVTAFVDGVPVGSTAVLTNMSISDCTFEINAQNGTTTSDRQQIVDKAAIYLQAP